LRTVLNSVFLNEKYSHLLSSLCARVEALNVPISPKLKCLDKQSQGNNTSFCGLNRQAKYLAVFDSMPNEAQCALQEVYHLAMQAQGGGSHVLMAYLYATQYPEIARLVIENVVLRFRLTQVRNTQTGNQIQQRLEDFHIALEAFVSCISLDDAEEKRRQQKEHPPCHWVPKQEYEGFRSLLATKLSSISSFIKQCQAKTNKLKTTLQYR
jgi:hypothetical protein